jgi:Flp pilus assembly protein TadG
LVEVALVVPLLLVLVIGVVELGRAFSYNVMLQNAVREGAAYAARSLIASDTSVSQRVCDATGWSQSGSCTDLVVVVTRNGIDDAIVDATYVLHPITALFASSTGMDRLQLHASASFPITRTPSVP